MACKFLYASAIKQAYTGGVTGLPTSETIRLAVLDRLKYSIAAECGGMYYDRSANPDYADATNLTIYNADKLHLNDNGYTREAADLAVPLMAAIKRLSAPITSVTSTRITWPALIGATSFKVYRSQTNNKDTAPVVYTGNLHYFGSYFTTWHNYIDTGLASGTYYYWISAIGPCYTESPTFVNTVVIP